MVWAQKGVVKRRRMVYLFLLGLGLLLALYWLPSSQVEAASLCLLIGMLFTGLLLYFATRGVVERSRGWTFKVSLEGLEWWPYVETQPYGSYSKHYGRWAYHQLVRLEPIFHLLPAKRAALHGALGRYGLRLQHREGGTVDFFFKTPKDWQAVVGQILWAGEQRGVRKGAFLPSRDLSLEFTGRQLWSQRFYGVPWLEPGDRTAALTQSVVLAFGGGLMLALWYLLGNDWLALAAGGLILLGLLLYEYRLRRAWKRREAALGAYLLGRLAEGTFRGTLFTELEKAEVELEAYPERVETRKELDRLLDYLNSSEDDRTQLQNSFLSAGTGMFMVALVALTVVYLIFLGSGVEAGFYTLGFAFIAHTVGLGFLLTFRVLPRFIYSKSARVLALLMRPNSLELLLLGSTIIALTGLTFFWEDKLILFLADVVIWAAFYPQLRPTMVETPPLWRLVRLYFEPIALFGLIELAFEWFEPFNDSFFRALVMTSAIGLAVHGTYVYRYGDCLAALWKGAPNVRFYSWRWYAPLWKQAGRPKN